MSYEGKPAREILGKKLPFLRKHPRKQTFLIYVSGIYHARRQRLELLQSILDYWRKQT